MQTKVSMVVPCYNKAAYIGEMLESVCNQEWDNIELILVNDGSTDGTRQVIAEWESRLRERGYDVIIIDQENQGLPAAILTGLRRITGDYFCSSDCDDILHPEFVSARARWLDQNPDYDGAACDLDRGSWYKESPKGLRCPKTAPLIVEPPASLEQLLLWRFAHTICLVMSRRRSLEKYRVFDSFFTDPPVCQEPQMFIPLHYHGAKIRHLTKTLYQYRKVPDQMSAFKSIEMYGDNRKRYSELVSKVLNAVITDPKENAYYTNLWSISEFILYLRGAIKYGMVLDESFRNRLREFLSGFCDMSGKDEDIVRQPLVLLRAVENSILKQPYHFPELKKSYRRIIGYGALGQSAKYLIPAIFDTPLHPTIFWDRAAKPDMKLHDISVEAPDWGSLTPDDMLLVFVKDFRAAKDILNKVLQSNVGTSLFHYDIMDYLARYHYPELTPDSVSVPLERSIGIYDE